MSKKKRVFASAEPAEEVLKMLDQDIDSDFEVEQNESDTDLDRKITDNTADTNSIVPENLISKVNEGDSDESSEDIDDDSYFGSNNDNNTLISTMYENRDETM